MQITRVFFSFGNCDIFDSHPPYWIRYLEFWKFVTTFGFEGKKYEKTFKINDFRNSVAYDCEKV